MPPPRDAFALVLESLRRRLSSGTDPPGSAIPIQGIADELRLSPTPVREALSRLAGEGLVDKSGPNYLRPRLDATTLIELYNLRGLYLAAAIKPRTLEIAGLRLAESALLMEPSDDDQRDDAKRCVELYGAVIRASEDRTLAIAYRQCAQRLAPYISLESRLLDQLDNEAQRLEGLIQVGETRACRTLVRRQHRRRMMVAGAVVRLADGKDYRSNMI